MTAVTGWRPLGLGSAQLGSRGVGPRGSRGLRVKARVCHRGQTRGRASLPLPCTRPSLLSLRPPLLCSSQGAVQRGNPSASFPPDRGSRPPSCLLSRVFRPGLPGGASDLSEETDLILSAPLLCLSGGACRPRGRGVVDTWCPPSAPRRGAPSSSASLSARAPRPPCQPQSGH